MTEATSVYYQSASQHFVSRFQMRDNVTLFFLAATGTILSVAFGSDAVQREVLLVLPYLALACTPLVVHHNVMLGALLTYLSKEIAHAPSESESSPPPFESSLALDSSFDLALNLRTIGQLIVLSLPSVLALVINFPTAGQATTSTSYAYWFAVVCVLLTAAMIVSVHLLQKHHMDHLRTRAAVATANDGDDSEESHG